MAKGTAGKQFLNFRNKIPGIKENMITTNQRIQKVQYFSPASADEEIEEQIVFVTAQAVAETVKERPTKARSPTRERTDILGPWLQQLE